MMRDFTELAVALARTGVKRKAAIVWAEDSATRDATLSAVKAGVIEAWFVGARDAVEADGRFAGLPITIIDAPDSDTAATMAVAMAREGKVDMLMKGLINTDNLLRAVLNKETGILPAGEVLTHITVAEIPAYDKLLLFTDAAVIPYPNDAQRDAQLRYVLRMARSLGIDCPKVSLVHCSEKVNEKHFPFTTDYVRIKQAAADGAYGKCIVDGPLDVKTSCSLHALEEKGLTSPLNGEADALIFPDIEAGNTFYKALTLFAGAQTAGLLCGTSVPVVLPSRGDSDESKFNSLLMASL